LPQAQIGVFHIEEFGVELLAEFFDHLIVFGMFRVGEDFQEIIVTPDAANILRRAGAFALQTYGILRALLDGQDGFDVDGVFPTVAEIIFVDELESFALHKLIQAVTLFVLQVFAVSVFFFGFAVVFIVNDELV
jgi:hypothetical protein